MDHYKSGKRIFLFGANIFSQIITSKIPEKMIYGIVDNDKNKQNRYLYGTKIKFTQCRFLEKISNCSLYLHAGEYEKRLKQVRSINKKCLFI